MLRVIWASGDTVWLRRNDPLGQSLSGVRCLLALAGVTSGDGAQMAANTTTAIDALEAARAAGVSRVFLFSSAAIYGRADGPLTEICAPTPASPYGQAKAEMEAAMRDWADRYPDGPEAVVLRLGNVAGADALLSRLDGRMPTLETFPDGTTPRRSYMGPITLANALAVLADHPGPLPRILNLTTPRAVEMAALLRAAGQAWEAVQARESAIAQVRLDTTLLDRIAPTGADSADPSRIVAEWQKVCG